VFEHSLRIRVKAETSNTEATAATSTVTTPDTGSVIEHSPSDSSDETAHSIGATEDTLHSSDETVHASSASTSSTSTKGKQKSSDAEADDKKSTGDNLVGKINNLVTTDLNNITEARDFLFMILYIPVQIILCIIFLYIVLGWRYDVVF
jgi:hypothetical protein